MTDLNDSQILKALVMLMRYETFILMKEIQEFKFCIPKTLGWSEIRWGLNQMLKKTCWMTF